MDVGRQDASLIIATEAGGYWSLGRKEYRASAAPDRRPPLTNPGTADVIAEDTLMKIAEDGTIAPEVSIPQILGDSALDA